jgi:hypothetical protein
MFFCREADVLSFSNQSPWQILLLWFTLFLLTGCGTGLDLAEVSGVVSVNGTPLPGVIVGFTPKESGRGSGNMTNEQGEYRLVFNRDSYGALVGEHKVTVRLDRAPPGVLPKGDKRKLVLEFDVIVESGKENVINLELLPG